MPTSSANSETPATHVVELTPPGRGAVAVVLVTGREAQNALDRCFHTVSGRPLSEAPPGRITLGRWNAPDGEEVVACRRSADQFEIHCHGGVAAVGAVVGRLLEQGCQRMSWQEWLRQTSRDPIQVAARIALAEATTTRTAAILLDQYHGALRTAIQQLAACVAAGDWAQAVATLDAVAAHRDVGLHLTSPWRVVLAGPTNVGKSSLINALAGFERAIVSYQPGTTRDVVTTITAIDGWPVELADTAGLRETGDALESAGIELATARVAKADLVVVVYDASETSAQRTGHDVFVESLISCLLPTVRRLRVINKIDLIPNSDRSRFAPSGRILASALTGEGIADLVTAIGRELVPAAPPAGTAVPFTAEQFAALDAARRAVDRRDTAAALAALQPLLAS